MALTSVISRLKKGLEKTRQSFVAGLRSLIAGRAIDDDLLKQIERQLIESDVGVTASRRLVEDLREESRAGRIHKGEDVIEHIKRELKSRWPEGDRRLNMATDGPTVILVTGVNGVGKTTSIAKLGARFQSQGLSVLLAAGDTYRAGAVQQLKVWADRLGAQLVRGQQGGDPASVAFDAAQAAIAQSADVLIIDTAGRLHTEQPLMRQLEKIKNVVGKKIPGAPHEVLLVLDATAGQNGLRQAEAFAEAVDLTGVFLAKLDGTARGGIVVAIRDAVDVPVKFVGVGERPEDIETFDPDSFVEALFAE